MLWLSIPLKLCLLNEGDIVKFYGLILYILKKSSSNFTNSFIFLIYNLQKVLINVLVN